MSSTNLECAVDEGTACRRRAVMWASASCGVFFCLTTLYCYADALVFGGYYQANFGSVISCVSRDWLLWLISFPLLAHLAVHFDFASRSGRAGIIRLLVIYTFALGAVRMAAEYLWGPGTVAEVLMIYLPRYLFVTALLIMGGIFYVFKVEADYRIRMLQRRFAQVAAAEADRDSAVPEKKTLVAYKGNSRVLVPVEEIVCISACGNYVELETEKGQFLLRGTMKELAGQLCPQHFVRVHRSRIVKLDALESVCCGRLQATLTNGKTIRIGRTYLKQLPHAARR